MDYFHFIFRGVMVTFVRKGHDDPSSIPGRDSLHSTKRWYLWEKYESSYSPYGAKVKHTGFFKLGMSVLDMTQNYKMVRPLSWSFG